MSDFLKNLNPVQEEAVTQNEGPVLVIAGAGSGKTRVLTYRIAFLLAQGVPAWNILALTFTNKASREMRERIGQLVGDQISGKLWMGTFHSIFARLLRKEHTAAGYPATFTIYDTDDSKNLIKTIIKDLNLNDQVYVPVEMMRRISQVKNQLITSESYKTHRELIAVDEKAKKPDTFVIYETYARRCRTAGVMDFDDLLLNTYLLFHRNPDILDKYQRQFQYLLVDEYQDTNYAQYMIVKQLAAMNRNVCVVGDDSQSIYSFRGAKIENILNFQIDYPEYQLFKLEQNYRSTQNIVEAANSLIAHNHGRIPKKIWSAKEPGDLIEVVEAATDQEEGFIIASRILDIHLRQQTDFKDFAVLYRTHAQSRVLEEACRKQNIPYKIYGSISFYQRKEIKDILAYMRVVVNRKDEESIKRIINFPARGIGKTTLDRLTSAAHSQQVSLWEILGDPVGFVPQFNRGTEERLREFRKLVMHLEELSEQLHAFDFANQLLQKTGILTEYRYDRTPEGISKYENIQELINGIKVFTDMVQVETGDPGTLTEFLENVALLTDQDNDKPEDRNKVSLMTIHAAKGLEYKFVFIAGLEEELFPNQYSVFSDKELEEERRLFYVAITRAMNRATISYAKTRFRWGNLVSSSMSRFIREINPKYLQLPRVKKERSLIELKASRTPDPKSVAPVIPQRRNLRPVKSAMVQNANPFTLEEADDPNQIIPGMMVEHARFGQGKVLQIEGSPDNRKATVFFRSAGQKQLLLKFARLKIIPPS